ncbi:unnamed protein product [Arctia plantaginis]|uniref:Uncharacterized protein n=1 Tax=Arctia plantaginis TaxID=874455 RepID=A0A8S0ZF33_ARCPL|nr:unnamed protein product [Arctia plantaginis]
MNRPVKENLDPKLVENIVKIVSARFYLPKKIVRSSIPSNTPMRLNCTESGKSITTVTKGPKMTKNYHLHSHRLVILNTQTRDAKQTLVPTREKLQTQSFKNVYQCYGNAFFDRQTVMNRTARNILELELVEDMVKIVSTQCNIPKKKLTETVYHQMHR